MTEAANRISQVTRRDLFDFLALEQIAWWGRLEEVQFLRRIWNLEEMPSDDPRFTTASGDIRQHRWLNKGLLNDQGTSDYAA